MDTKQAIVAMDLELLGHHLRDAHGHASVLVSALLGGAGAVERARRALAADTDPEATGDLVRALGAVEAEQAALGRALDEALDALARLPVRLDLAAVEPR